MTNTPPLATLEGGFSGGGYTSKALCGSTNNLEPNNHVQGDETVKSKLNNLIVRSQAKGVLSASFPTPIPTAFLFQVDKWISSVP